MLKSIVLATVALLLVFFLQATGTLFNKCSISFQDVTEDDKHIMKLPPAFSVAVGGMIHPAPSPHGFFLVLITFYRQCILLKFMHVMKLCIKTTKHIVVFIFKFRGR